MDKNATDFFSTDFILEVPDLLSEEYCQLLIDKFNGSPLIKPGQTGSGIDKAKKDSDDIVISQFPEWKAECNQLSHILLSGLIPYFRQHPYLLIGAISVATVDPKTQQTTSITANDIDKMSDDQLSQMIRRLFRLGEINLQKYKRNQGGYHHWHSEIFPHPDSKNQEPLHRVLLWMFYLNDVEDGGETSFYFQQRNVSPKRGSLVLAPAGFTHTHKGQIPKSSDKYILTSWLMFRKSEEIYSS